MKSKRRSRFNLEKQRRAGSSQIYELLLYTGRFEMEFLQKALEEVNKSSAAEEARQEGHQELQRLCFEAKHERRLGLQLHRAVQHGRVKESELSERRRRILQESRWGILDRRVNSLVLSCGRGRLRGERPEDDIDLGTNQDRSVVAHLLDGVRPSPDTSRFRYMEQQWVG